MVTLFRVSLPEFPVIGCTIVVCGRSVPCGYIHIYRWCCLYLVPNQYFANNVSGSVTVWSESTSDEVRSEACLEVTCKIMPVLGINACNIQSFLLPASVAYTVIYLWQSNW